MSDPSAAPGGSEAGVPTKPRPRDLRAALPTAAGGGFLVAAAALALGQIPPLLVNLFGGGLALSTQIRLGWLYTAAANAIPGGEDGAARNGPPRTSHQAVTPGCTKSRRESPTNIRCAFISACSDRALQRSL